ncbi:MAG TPA: long-chain fatty acid--CoA ligase [Balneolaceae bacterium]|nr:long-chain fatty acid--CoA ligase [Balneolaceae bacterium]
MSQSKTTLPAFIQEGLDRHPGGVLASVKRGGEWVETDLETFRTSVRNFAMGLYELGVRSGERVSLHSENSVEWLICDLAILPLGAVSVPIYSTQPGDQIKYILENSEAAVHIVSTHQLFKETKPLVKGIPSLRNIISIQSTEHKKLLNFGDVKTSGAQAMKRDPGLLDRLINQIGPDDLATIIYTSGTTGKPKGVMLSHNNIASNVMASLQKLPFSAEEFRGRNVLSYLPLSHVFERMIEYTYLSMGSRIWYIESITEITGDFIQVRPLFFATVPRLLEKIHTGVKVKGQEYSGLKKWLYYRAVRRASQYDPEKPPSGLAALDYKINDFLVYRKIRKMFGGELKGMVSGGAALSGEVFRFMNAIGFICIQGYGLTETSPVIAVQTPGEMRPGSAGKPLSNVEVTIAEDREILTRGPHVMLGYYNNPEMTREAMTEDGWFKTGDVGKIDEDGYLFITDRKKAMFKLSTGKYVAPQNVEGALSHSGFIEQVMVIGNQRKFCSAIIVPSAENVKKRLKRENYQPTEPLSMDERVRGLIQGEVDTANQKMSPWERVKKFVLLDEPFSIESGELTPTHKIKRQVVQERYKENIEAIYSEEKGGQRD